MHKYLLKIVVLFISIILLGACDDPDDLVDLKICMDEYFYYTNNEKVIIHLSLEGLRITFNDSVVVDDGSIGVLDKYSYLSYYTESKTNFKVIYAKISSECNCEIFRNYIAELNSDPEIYSAQLYFYFESDPENEHRICLENEFFFSLNDDVNIIDFQYVLDSMGLEIIDESSGFYFTKVLTINTGFEPLNKANQLYEHSQVKYSHPNFSNVARLP